MAKTVIPQGDRIKIAVLVSGGGTNLAALIAAERDGLIPHGSISLVISNNPDAYALTRAKEAGISAMAINKRQCADAAEFEDKLAGALEDAGIEMIILAGFMVILSENFVSKYPERIINIHPSLIPSFCGKGFYGLRVHEAALARGVKLTGATAHYVNEIPDGGRIICQKSVPICEGDTPEILQRRVMERAEWKIFPRAAELAAREIFKAKIKTKTKA